MSWITPLGFLGLLGIAVLILIYLLKPNYQQKIVSSTYVWKLSLKYRRKKLPISKLRNILIIICQILIITSCAMILAQPVIQAEIPEEKGEKIAVIDASATMLAKYEDQTRFARAVGKVKELADTARKNEQVLTVILAGEEASVLLERGDMSAMTAEEYDAFVAQLTALTGSKSACSYMDGDVDAAMALAEEVVLENPDAEVLFYTATNYIEKGNVQIVTEGVVNDAESNAAILDGRTRFEDNRYVFEIDVAYYDKGDGAMQLRITADAYGINGTKVNANAFAIVNCDSGERQTVIFSSDSFTITSGSFEEGDDESIDSETGNLSIFSYDYVMFQIDEALLDNDSYSYDNYYVLYGGTQPTINIQYTSSKSNRYFAGVLRSMKTVMKNRWDLRITDVKDGSYAVEGFDLYIFEHVMPEVMPIDGAVFLVDMDDEDKVPEGLNAEWSKTVSDDFFQLAQGDDHQVTEGIDPAKIEISKYTPLELGDEGFQTLWYCGGDPVFAVKNTTEEKVALLSIDLNYSLLPGMWEFPTLISQLFSYLIPETVTAEDAENANLRTSVFDVGQKVTFNSRGRDLTVFGNGVDQTFDEFPTAEFTFTEIGAYTLEHTLLGDKGGYSEYVYIKIASKHSDIWQSVDVLNAPQQLKKKEPQDEDLLAYFAAALVFLLFAEWWLQAREQF